MIADKRDTTRPPGATYASRAGKRARAQVRYGIPDGRLDNRLTGRPVADPEGLLAGYPTTTGARRRRLTRGNLSWTLAWALAVAVGVIVWLAVTHPTASIMVGGVLIGAATVLRPRSHAFRRRR